MVQLHRWGISRDGGGARGARPDRRRRKEGRKEGRRGRSRGGLSASDGTVAVFQSRGMCDAPCFTIYVHLQCSSSSTWAGYQVSVLCMISGLGSVNFIISFAQDAYWAMKAKPLQL